MWKNFVNSFDFSWEKLRERFGECSFSSKKSNELIDQQDMFCFNHASAFCTSNDIDKNVDK